MIPLSHIIVYALPAAIVSTTKATTTAYGVNRLVTSMASLTVGDVFPLLILIKRAREEDQHSLEKRALQNELVLLRTILQER